jgi:hypothetical protein
MTWDPMRALTIFYKTVIPSGDAGRHYALGLTLTRLKRHPEALRRATELDGDSARYAYFYGVALHYGGHVEQAMVVLKDNLVRHPDDQDALLALISHRRKSVELLAPPSHHRRLLGRDPANYRNQRSATFSSLFRQHRPQSGHPIRDGITRSLFHGSPTLVAYLFSRTRCELGNRPNRLRIVHYLLAA